MTCKITARVQRVESLRGRVRVEERITASAPRLAGPIVDGWYEGGVRQTRQFQQVLEELRLQHDPEHWASWSLDGSLEEDAGQFPLNYGSGWEWADMGPRKAVKFSGDGSANTSLMWGTDEDFAYLHQTAQYTMGAWVSGDFPTGTVGLIGTNTRSGGMPGAGMLLATNGQATHSLFIGADQRISGRVMLPVPELAPLFLVVRCSQITGGLAEIISNGVLLYQRTTSGAATSAHSYDPMTIGLRSGQTIWNAFCTSQVLTDAEIYRLYVAGMQELMG